MFKSTAIATAVVLSCTGGMASAAEIPIYDNDFDKHFKAAKPGDVFKIYPGLYKLNKTAHLEASGTKDNPIIIRPADESGKVIIEASTKVAFSITGAYWTVEGMNVYGACSNHGRCEHVIHISGNADKTVIRNNTFVDFNSAIKGNGRIINGRQFFPDHVLIENNRIYNNTPRNTSAPVTPVDVVGGRYWTVRGNFIADFAKAKGNKVSYAAFLKGNSDNGLFERNLVICEWRHTGGTRVGLSLGGGGTSNPDYCQGRSCKIEHYKGTIRSNVIMNCPKDVGIYLNYAANTNITNNTILNTTGVDVRFNGSFATMANNVIEGRILARDDGRFREINNLVEKNLRSLFPNLSQYDLTPSNPQELGKAAFGFEGVDYCTGKEQEDWKGAMVPPAQCKISDQLADIEADSGQ
ncbi:MAG: right-handed parallel beta-helix repeat-containing protein [Alphaproteobacteria bacterium]|nr:right-handed parallel beta-helix repeat-containing protein [Alphaproteobacteria bacterium]